MFKMKLIHKKNSKKFWICYHCKKRNHIVNGTLEVYHTKWTKKRYLEDLKRYNHKIVQITTHNNATDIESSAISCGQCGKINQLASYHRNSSGMVDDITYKNSLAKTTYQKISRDRFSHKIVFRRFNHSSKKTNN